MASIFVQIASYHDYELPRTIKDCLEKSSGENEIHFGVHQVYYEKDEILLPDVPNLKLIKYKAPQNIGVGVARYNCNELYNGEDYYLQTDGHMRFEKDWDKSIINDYEYYKSLGHNPILSAYPASYSYRDFKVEYQENPDIAYCELGTNSDYEQEQIRDTKILPHLATGNSAGYIYTKGISAAVIFGPGELYKIKPNKDMFFWGEETLMSLRFFTNGYDLMLPRKQVFYHLYFVKDSLGKNLRRHIWSDFSKESSEMEKASKNRLYEIVSKEIVGNQELGSVRTIADYEKFAQFSFKTGEIEIGLEHLNHT